MIVEIGLILTVVSIGLVAYGAARSPPVMLPVLALTTSLLGLAGLMQDSALTSDPWALSIVIILCASLALFAIGQLFERA